MDGNRAQEIREAYYKAVEGLMMLAEGLEVEDAKQERSAGPLLTEYLCGRGARCDEAEPVGGDSLIPPSTAFFRLSLRCHPPLRRRRLMVFS